MKQLNEMNDRQFLGWNQQVRSQLVEDLYYTCRQDGEILETILDEYVYLLKDNRERLDELQGWTNEVLGEDDWVWSLHPISIDSLWCLYKGSH